MSQLDWTSMCPHQEIVNSLKVRRACPLLENNLLYGWGLGEGLIGYCMVLAEVHGESVSSRIVYFGWLRGFRWKSSLTNLINY